VTAAMRTATVTNWARTHRCKPRRLHFPHDEEELCDILKQCVAREDTVRFIGGRNSPNDMAMSDSTLIDMSAMQRPPVLCADNIVRVSGGTTLEALSRFLKQHGKSLAALGAISRQTVAGAIATATHGTGLRVGNLSSYVTGARIANGLGELLTISAHSQADRLPAIACHLGQLGGLIEVSMRVVEDFDLEVSEALLDVESALDRMDDDLQSDHLRLHYLPGADKTFQWRATRIAPAAPGKAFSPARNHHAFSFFEKRCYEAMLYGSMFVPSVIPRANRWFAKRSYPLRRVTNGPNHDLFTMDCLFSQHTTEWAVPLPHARKVIEEVIALCRRMPYAAHMPIEIRFAAGDEVWMSPCQGAPRCYIGAVSYRPFGKDLEHRRYFEHLEDLMLAACARPHWAKTFTVASDRLRTIYPYWDQFQHVRAQMDPHGLFDNAYSRRVLGTNSSTTSEHFHERKHSYA
jgi:L-gulonolactone oxidase